MITILKLHGNYKSNMKPLQFHALAFDLLMKSKMISKSRKKYRVFLSTKGFNSAKIGL